MDQKILILGAGFGGLEAATSLSQRLDSSHQITLIDKNDHFIIGFSKFDVMFGRRPAEAVKSFYKNIAADNVNFVQDTIEHLDLNNKKVITHTAEFDYDFLIIALGAELMPEATPGFATGGYEFYSLAGAAKLAPVIADFRAGTILIAILGAPYKCPPAPYEAAFQLHDLFSQKGIRNQVEIKMLISGPSPLPVAKEAAAEIERRLAERNIDLLKQHKVISLNPANKEVEIAERESLRYDLFIGVPVHKPPQVVRTSALGKDGWILVNHKNLETSFENVYAVGDVTKIPVGKFAVSKAGAFAEAGAKVVVNDILNKINRENNPVEFKGTGTCYLEFGGQQVAKLNANFLGSAEPEVTLDGPSEAFRPDKISFEKDRIARWFK